MSDKVNYADFILDQSKDVLVPMSTYLAMTNVIQAVEQQHSKVMRTDVYAYYNRKTHKKLSAKSKAKMSPEKLAKEYYENIDLEETNKSTRVDRDELGSAAIKLLGEFRGVFKHNVDSGNAIPKPVPQAPPSNNVVGPKIIDDIAETDSKDEA